MSQTMVSPAAQLKTGFADAVFDSQSAFRTVLDAMSYPGRIQTLAIALDPPAPLHPAMAAIGLTLFDFDTPVWLDAAAASAAAADFFKFHSGCPIVETPGQAQFAMIADTVNLPPLDDFAIGEDKYPDRSATLIVQVPSLTEGVPVRWTGPGINGVQLVAIGGLPGDFWSQWSLNGELYPLGVDLLFVCGRDIVGLPRTIKVEG